MKIDRAVSAWIACALVLCALALPAGAEDMNVSALYKNRDVDDLWTAAGATLIDLNAQTDGAVVRITAKGDYVLSGALKGQILIDAGKDDKVRLILNGVSIESPQGPAIYEKQADKLVVTLAAGTENALADGPAITDGDDTIAAALYAEDDLSINGTGSLTANGGQKHGIQSKADLILANGQISVSAAMDGIRGRNSVLVLGGVIRIQAGGDGITSTRADKEGKGWIVLAGGSVDIQTGDGAGAVRAPANSMGMGMGGSFGGRGGRDDWGRGSGSAQEDKVSQKAVKAAADLTVLDGVYVFNCADDGLHAVNVTVSGGSFSILSGDDALHADQDLTVNGGILDIPQCYEGLEGQNVTVNDGRIRIVASDDGINAAGGSDGSGFGGWGWAMDAADNGGMLVINGGRLSVSAGGDALDSNGSIQITGGVAGVWAATSTGEGAIDFNGAGTLSGGTLIVASTGGVMRDTSRMTGQAAMAFQASGGAGETVSLLDQSGAVLGEFTLENAFDTLMVSSPQLPEGSGFTVLCNGRTLYSGVMSTSQNGMNGNNGFGNGGNRNRRGW